LSKNVWKKKIGKVLTAGVLHLPMVQTLITLFLTIVGMKLDLYGQDE